MSNTVEIFDALFYTCPLCSTSNTIRYIKDLGDNFDSFQGVCSKCKERSTVGKLMSHYFDIYGDNFPIRTICMFALEFICNDCGNDNLILPTEIKIENIDDGTKIKPHWNNSPYLPSSSICWNCKTESKFINTKNHQRCCIRKPHV